MWLLLLILESNKIVVASVGGETLLKCIEEHGLSVKVQAMRVLRSVCVLSLFFWFC